MSTVNDPSTNWLRSLFAKMTIGRKVVAIVILCVGFGFLLMISVQITGTRANLYNLTIRHSLQVTKLLATTIAGGVRWQQPEAIERSYRSFFDGNDPGFADFIALDIAGQVLSAHNPTHISTDESLAAILEESRGATDQGDLYVVDHPQHNVVVAPIVIGRDKVRVGTLVVAWSLEELNARIAADLDRQVIVAGFTLVALIVMLLALLSYTVTMPLRAVSRATMLIAQCESSVAIPETKRGDEIGEMARALEVFKDHIAMIDEMSEGQEQHRQQLSEALENERKYNALHREFVSMASHEFRTPLAIIDGAAQRILRRADRLTSDELVERVGKIRHAVTRMIGLIDSTLSASRMESGHMELAVQPCSLPQILGAVCQRQQEISPEHEISLDVEQAPEQIIADPKQLDQIFTNFLSNSVKYSPGKGRIEVTARADGEYVTISFHDHGVGIPEDEMPKLFERFFRASTSTGIPGTGIGLNLVKQLVEMHSGSIDVSSAEGEGSTFSARLPVGTADEGINSPHANEDAGSGDAELRAAAQR